MANCRRQQATISRAKLRARHLATQNLELVAQHQQLKELDLQTAATPNERSQQRPERKVEKRQGHSRRSSQPAREGHDTSIGALQLIDDPLAIAERLTMLLAEDGWLAAEHQAPGVDTYRQHVLYVSPCRRMSVVALVWRPGQSTPIHDHVAWCVVGVYRGVEREERYRLIEVDGESCLQPSGSVDAHAGHVEALVPPVDDIHAVTAAGDELAISLHVYGADIERPGSSIHRRFDDVRVLARA